MQENEKDKTFRIWNEVLVNNGRNPISREEFDRIENESGEVENYYVCTRPCSHWGGETWAVGDRIPETRYLLHENKDCFELVPLAFCLPDYNSENLRAYFKQYSIFSISKIEKTLGMPDKTLWYFVKGQRGLGHWEEKVIAYVSNIAYDPNRNYDNIL